MNLPFDLLTWTLQGGLKWQIVHETLHQCHYFNSPYSSMVMVVPEKRCVVIAPDDVDRVNMVDMTFVCMSHGEQA